MDGPRIMDMRTEKNLSTLSPRRLKRELVKLNATAVVLIAGENQ